MLTTPYAVPRMRDLQKFVLWGCFGRGNTLPIEKIERDGDKVLGGRRFLFLSNNQPKDGVRD